MQASLVALGAEAKRIGAATNLAATVTAAAIGAVARHNLALFPAGAATPRTCVRQDALMPALASAASSDYNRDWKAQPEHTYIHMLLLVAAALRPVFAAVLAALVSDLVGVELHGVEALGHAFARMVKQLATEDKHVVQKPRPAANIDIVRMLVSASSPDGVVALVGLVAARFDGLSHSECLPELAATDPAAADARHHVLPVVVTVTCAPEGLTVGGVLADPTVRAAWAELRAARPPAEVSTEQWQVSHDTAVHLLETNCDVSEPVKMHCEVQVMTTAMAAIQRKIKEVQSVMCVRESTPLEPAAATPRVVCGGVDWGNIQEGDLWNAANGGQITTVKRLLASKSIYCASP